MAITPIDSIAYANQATSAVASKKGEYDNRLQKQAYASVEESLKKDIAVAEVNELTEDKEIDPQVEHDLEEEMQKNNREKKEIKKHTADDKKSKEKKEELDTTYHILNIKV